MWNILNNIETLDKIVKDSYNKPVAIFKHSTTCSISGMSKLRLEDHWHFQDLDIYYLDLLNHRSLSNEVANRFAVHHESPQILLIVNGECIYDASHFDISVSELQETLKFHKITVA